MSDFATLVGAEGPVTVVGGRTRWHVGGEVHPDAREVHAPSGVVSYDPAEMTVTVRAGTTTAELTAALAEAGQRCALPERGGTVGGSVVIGENHPEVSGRGWLTSSVLQVTYISAEGKLIRGGGPTVKNVSGFDLPRLIVGSLGTLGLVEEVILRTNPIPPRSQWVESHDADPFTVASQVLRPSAVLWNGSSTRVLLEGHAPDVAASLNSLTSIGAWSEVDGSFDFPQHRWSLQPAELNGCSGTFVASIGVGTVWRDEPQSRPALSPSVIEISTRMKNNFDPTGRLNPGRSAF
ncbi:MAG: FAD-binding protein [Ilumatobacteraceae bacterium]